MRRLISSRIRRRAAQADPAGPGVARDAAAGPARRAMAAAAPALARRARRTRARSPTPPMSASPTAGAMCSRRRRATAPTARRWCRAPGSFRPRAARRSRPDPRHPAGVAPGKRPRLTPEPGAGDQAAAPSVMPFGTPGGDVQTQAMLQVLLNIFVRHGSRCRGRSRARASPATASRPRSRRYDYYPGPAQDRGPHSERRPATRWRGAATRSSAGPTGSGSPARSARSSPTTKRGVMEAGADPRRAAYALGW